MWVKFYCSVSTIQIYLEIPQKIGKKVDVHYYENISFCNKFAFSIINSSKVVKLNVQQFQLPEQ